MKHFYRACLLSAILLAAMVWMVSCTAYRQQREERKDQKAIERVLGSETLTARVGKRVATGNDTSQLAVAKTDSGKIPPPPKPVLTAVKDSSCTQYEQYINSLVYSTQKVIDTTIGQNIRIRIDELGIKAWSTSLHTTTKIVDRGLANAWRDSTDAAKVALVKANVLIEQLTKQVSALQADTLAKAKQIIQLQSPPANKGIRWYWWVVIGIAAAVVAVLMAAKKLIPWVAVIKAFNTIIGFFKKKSTAYGASVPVSASSNGYYRLYPLNKGWQYQRVADNNRALSTSQLYDDRSSALAGILADKKLRDMPIKEAKGPLPL